MSKERNPTVPFGTFYHPPVQLADVMREKDCLASSTFAVMNGLFSLIDFNRTIRIGKYDIFEGWTVVVSYDGIGRRCGLSGRRCQDALKKLEKAGLIASEKIGKCKRHRIMLYVESINHLKANPNQPMKQLTQPIGSTEHKSAVKRIQDDSSIIDNDETSDIETNQDDSSSGIRTERHPIQDGASCTQESYQESVQDPPVFPSTGTRREEQGGDFSNDERQEQDEESPNGEIDVVATTQIGNANDLIKELTQAKSMNVSQTDESVESFIISFNDAFGYETPVVTDEKLARAASELQEHLEGLLSSASIAMPPLLFFKHCIQETNNRLASGELTEKPKHPNFYRNLPSGKEIVELCVKKLGSENRATRDRARTDARLNKIKKQSDEPREMPAETKAALDELFGRA